MPFVTEELWQSLKAVLPEGWQLAESIMIAPYPVPDGNVLDPEAEKVMAAVIDIIHSIRNVRAEHRVEVTKWITARVYAGKLTPDIRVFSGAIENLSRARPVDFRDGRPEGLAGNALALVLKESEVIIPLESMVDPGAERIRLEKEIEQCRASIDSTEARLKDEAFLNRAPATVVAKERDKVTAAKDRLNRLQESLNKLN
jgi:valyl-tRNA synthetase